MRTAEKVPIIEAGVFANYFWTYFRREWHTR